jgi:hypothetical protein
VDITVLESKTSFSLLAGTSVFEDQTSVLGNLANLACVFNMALSFPMKMQEAML